MQISGFRRRFNIIILQRLECTTPESTKIWVWPTTQVMLMVRHMLQKWNYENQVHNNDGREMNTLSIAAMNDANIDNEDLQLSC